MAVDIRVPPVVFKTRIEIDEAPGFKWYDLSANEMFGNRRVAVFGLPGAFTPTCSSTHVPTFDAYYDEICNHNIDEIYCISVNDAYGKSAQTAGREIVHKNEERRTENRSTRCGKFCTGTLTSMACEMVPL